MKQIERPNALFGATSAALAAWLILGCGTSLKAAPTTPSEPTSAAVSAAAQMDASRVAEITFAKGSFSLTAESRETLSEMVRKARNSGKINDVKVAAWADTEYPSEREKQLSKAERDLADKRAETVKKYLDTLNVDDVDTYNMAKRPNGIAEFFDTSDARVKHALETAGIPTSQTDAPVTGKASRAVVMVILDK